MHTRTSTKRATKAAALSGLLIAAVAMSGCGNGAEDSGNSDATAGPVAVTHAGGIYLLDPNTLAMNNEVQLPGFNRIDPAGDDRHMFVRTKDAFRVLDATTGEFTGREFPGADPGHVVGHAGRTVLFTDGTGTVISLDPEGLGGGDLDIREYRASAPHHGVAVELADGTLAVTLGDDSEDGHGHGHEHGHGHGHDHAAHAEGMVVLDNERNEIARSTDCPGVHGEATAQGEAVLIGCENGALVYRDGEITKIASPTPYGRIGNQASTEDSPIVLGDYKTDENAELERPQQISLIDTHQGTLELVDLGTSYSSRSLARGPHGEALVLGTDGMIHVIDPESGQQQRTIPAIEPWQEPTNWKEPSPGLFVRDGVVYVVESAKQQVHRIDLASGETTASVTLPAIPNEISGVDS